MVSGNDYYDVVIYRRVRDKTGDQVWRRGANLKPTDLPDLLELLGEIAQYLRARGVVLTKP
jgi:hypothetical protein